MLKQKLFGRLRPRTTLGVLLVVLSLSTGLVLYRAYRTRHDSQQKGRVSEQITKTLKENRENLKFIENKGQWPSEVLFGLETATGAVWLRKDDVLFRAFNKKEDSDEDEDKEEQEEHALKETPEEKYARENRIPLPSKLTAEERKKAEREEERHEREEKFEAHAWKMRLVGMDQNYKVRTGGLQPTEFSYFLGQDSVAGARSFKEIILESVYPGVDLRFYSGDNKQIEYDFIVAPGADFRKIKIEYEGQDSLKVGADNSLEVGLHFGTVKTHLPEAYQVRNGEKVIVPIGFEVDGNRASFRADAPIDPNLPLVIDPTLLWGTYFDNGTTTFDAYCYASKADVCGNVYVGGYANEAIVAAYVNATGFSNVFVPQSSAVLYKFNPSGSAILNFTYFGGGGFNRPASGLTTEISQTSTFIDLDIFPNGNVIAVGRSAGSFITTNAYQPNQGTIDPTDGTGMIAIFNPTLTSVLYSSYLGGDNMIQYNLDNNVVRSVVVAGDNTYYVGGSISGVPLGPGFLTGPIPDSTNVGIEGYVARFSGANYNTLDWATLVGGDHTDHVFSVKLTPDNSKVVFAGHTEGFTDAGFPTLVNPVDVFWNGQGEGWVGTLQNVATRQSNFTMLSIFGGDGGDIRPVATSNNTHIFAAWTTDSFTQMPGSVNTPLPFSNIIVARIPLNGILGGSAVSRYLGGSDFEDAGGIILNTNNELIVFGDSQSNNYPVVDTVPGTTFYQPVRGGGRDIVMTYLPTSLAAPTFSTYMGGGINDYLGDTGILAGGGHLDFNPTTGVITLATTVHSNMPTTIVPPSGVFDSNKTIEALPIDTHLTLKLAADVNDFGDAPLTYDNSAANAARHGVTSTLGPSYARMGLLVDVDTAPQSTAAANGDDINNTLDPCSGTGGDDEDGVTLPVMQACTQTYTVTVNAFKNSASAANIYGWLDVNNDGVFQATEVSVGVLPAVTNGVQTNVNLSFAVTAAQAAAAPNGFYARFRITTDVLNDDGLTPFDDRSRGQASNGEVEDYLIPFIRRDYGDAPDTYQTLAASGGPSHLITAGVFIGAASPATDSECDGTPGVNSNFDDRIEVDDETVISTLAIATTATVVNIPVPYSNASASAGTLCGWIDFNRNGSFSGAEGRCTLVAAASSGSITLTWSSIAGPIVAGQSYLRLRLLAGAGLNVGAWGGALGSGEVEDHPVTINGTTSVDLASFKAYLLGNSVFLDWKTGYESNNLGFNVFREVGGKRTPVTPSLIAGSALTVGQGVRVESGFSYAWRDDIEGDPAGVQYWIEDVDINGTVTSHGPYSVTSGQSLPLQKRQLLASQPRALKLNELTDRLGPMGASHEAEPHADLEFSAVASGPPGAEVLRRVDRDRVINVSQQQAVKIEVKNAGWYRVPQAVLIAAGLDAESDPRNFHLYVDGKQVPIRVTGEEDGRFDSADAVEFYGVGLDIPSTDTRVYWLMASRLRGQRMPSSGAGGGGSPPPSFTHSVERKDRLVYVSAVLNGAADNFFGTPIAGSNPSVTQALATPNLYTEGNGAASLDVAIQGVSQHEHSIKVTINGVVVGSVTFSGQERGFKTFPIPQSLLVAGDNLIKLEREGAEPDVTLVDSLRLTYQHAWKADNNAVLVQAQGGQQVTIGGFTSQNVRIIDVTDLDSPSELTGEVSQQQGAFTISAAITSQGTRRLYAFSSDVVRTPAGVAANHASAWKSATNRADLVVIGHSSVLAGVTPLVELRRSQGWSVLTVDVADLYDEFTFGHKTPEAIADFIRYAATTWALKPKAILLLGKATYDPRSYMGQGDPDLVPTQMVGTETMESAVDDSLADFDGDGIPELAVGRLPVRNLAETRAIVAKIVAYDSLTPSNRVALISDINDTYSFDGVTTQLKGTLPAGTQVQEISRGQLGDGPTRVRVLEELNRAHRIINYVGHGSIQLWRGDMLTVDDAPSLQKTTELSVFVMMTCLNGYFVSPLGESLSESLLRSPGGAVAAWASSGTTTPEGQQAMNVAAFQQLFGGQGVTLGEAARAAKAAVGEVDIRRTWNLLGDPTMRLR